ncbi:MAG TPA: DUF2202 domain-containing protein [Candidatus Competibacter sp.]|nr:DUF2202 domain-containing protein [Candidatus Competibacter sp.]
MIFKLMDYRCGVVRSWLALILTIVVGNAWAQTAELSTGEIQTLTFMREEEKLARDVYLTLNDIWAQPVLANIAKSEQRHMDAMLALLDQYRLADPASPEVGVFNNTDLQALYEQLVARGRQSALEALYVGAAIEEIDILDLQRAIAETNHTDLQQSYENLLAGSNNHLRAFVRNIENQGLVYEPQYLSVEQLEAILTAPTQRTNPRGRNQNGRRGR